MSRASSALMVLLTACRLSPSPIDDTAIPKSTHALAGLTLTGPHAVGYRQSEVRYPDPTTGRLRTLRLALWYPSLDESGESATYLDVFEDADVWIGASHAPGPWPLALFSHGHQGYAENSSFLMAHLASHGWVVAAPDHTGNTTFDGASRTSAIYLQRPRDDSCCNPE